MTVLDGGESPLWVRMHIDDDSNPRGFREITFCIEVSGGSIQVGGLPLGTTIWPYLFADEDCSPRYVVLYQLNRPATVGSFETKAGVTGSSALSVPENDVNVATYTVTDSWEGTVDWSLS